MITQLRSHKQGAPSALSRRSLGTVPDFVQSPPLCVNNSPKGGMKSRLLSLESSTALKLHPPKSFWSTRIINGGMNPQTKQLLVTCHQSPTFIGDYMLVHCWLYGQISSCVNILPAIQMFFSFFFFSVNMYIYI